MIALIKNNQHYSNNYVSMRYNNSNIFTSIVKSSSHKDGIKSINSEVYGLDWYCERSSNELSYDVYRVSDSYINLRIKALNKIKILEKCSYSNYKDLIFKVVRHYCEVWNEGGDGKDVCALHGDLSLVGNVLFVDLNSPVFIDWEHFDKNAAPIGFDALNCILELLYYEDLNDINLLHSNLRHVSQMMSFLDSKKCLNKLFHLSPLLSMTDFMRKNSHLWGSQIDKFPVLKFSKDQVVYIDNYLNKVSSLVGYEKC
jgi:hypothetical protein